MDLDRGARDVGARLLVLTGTFEQLLAYTGFAVVLFAAVAVTALFVLRRKDTASSRLFSAWGYPWAPALFALAGAAIVINAIVTRTSTTLAGLAVMAAGLPLYVFMRRSTARPQSGGSA